MSKTVFLCDGNHLFKPISKMGRILKTNLTLAVKNYSAWLEFLSEQYLQPVKSFLLESFNSENFIPCAFMLYTLEGEGSRQRSGHIETGIRKCAHLSSSSPHNTVQMLPPRDSQPFPSFMAISVKLNCCCSCYLLLLHFHFQFGLSGGMNRRE